MSRRELEMVTRAALGLTAGLAAFASAAFAAESGDTLLRTVLAAPGGMTQHAMRILKEPATGQLVVLILAAVAFGAVSLRALHAAGVRARQRAELPQTARPRRREGELG